MEGITKCGPEVGDLLKFVVLSIKEHSFLRKPARRMGESSKHNMQRNAKKAHSSAPNLGTKCYPKIIDTEDCCSKRTLVSAHSAKRNRTFIQRYGRNANPLHLPPRRFRYKSLRGITVPQFRHQTSSFA